MQVSPHEYQIDELVRVFEVGSLLRNPEYQRGEAWNETQKATFIDSIFRRYPVPALFLHKVVSAGLGGSASEKFEIVDGQQRLTALRDFKAGKFSLLRVDGNSKLRLPKSVRSREAPWAGRVYSDLSSELTEQFLKTTITVFQIGPDAHPDEVRDLFIRLQSGTALSRQQIRDAWPGNLGPFIESLAGKLDRKPSIMLFRLVDKRGQRSDDDDQRDMFVSDRQFCAQGELQPDGLSQFLRETNEGPLFGHLALGPADLVKVVRARCGSSSGHLTLLVSSVPVEDMRFRVVKAKSMAKD